MNRLLLTTLCLVSLQTSALVPVLDAGELEHAPVLESRHDPSACVRGHDHSICTQVAGSRAVPAERVRHEHSVASPRADVRHVPPAPPLSHPALVPPLGSRPPPTV